MLYNKFKIFCIGLGFSVFLFSCKKELDVNLDNPNGISPTVVTADQSIPACMNSTAARINASYAFSSQWMGYWSRSGNYSPSLNLETFQLANSFGDGLWSANYKNIYDYNFAIQKAGINSYIGGIALIMKSLVTQNLVDIFGNIPYTEASQPLLTIRPKYDDAQAIYKDLIVKINAGIDAIKASTPAQTDITADIMFHGDKNKWVKFANTLKLRILMRQVPKGNQPYVIAQLAAISQEGFLSVGENAMVNPGYRDVVAQQSPLWGSFGFTAGTLNPIENNNYYRANKSMVDFLKSINDTIRLGYFFKKNETGGYDGNYFGETSTARQNSVTSAIGPGILQSPSQGALVISSFESLFLQAEAAQRGLIIADAADLYAKAVAESFRFLKVPNAAAEAANYLINSKSELVNFSKSTDKIQTIITQKYIALCGLNGLEAWNEYRRTGFPDRNNPSLNPGVIINKIPKRLLYPQSEYNLNADNVNAQNQKGSDLYTPIFWGL